MVHFTPKRTFPQEWADQFLEKTSSPFPLKLPARKGPLPVLRDPFPLSEVLQNPLKEAVQNRHLLSGQVSQDPLLQGSGDLQKASAQGTPRFGQAYQGHSSVALGPSPLEVPVLFEFIDQDRDGGDAPLNPLGKGVQGEAPLL